MLCDPKYWLVGLKDNRLVVEVELEADLVTPESVADLDELAKTMGCYVDGLEWTIDADFG